MNSDSMTVFEQAPVPKAVLQNTIPAMAAMLIVLIYNLADTFFIAQTHNDILVAAVSLATPVFLIFMAVGTVFGIGGTSVISRSFGQRRQEYAKKMCAFCMWSCVAVGALMSGRNRGSVRISAVFSLRGIYDETRQEVLASCLAFL